MTEEEMQAKIDEAVESAVSGLKTKNAELIGKLNKLRKQGDIDPEQVAEIEAARDKALTDLAKATKDLKAANANAEKIQKALQSETAFTQKLLVDNGLTAALTANNVTMPAMLKAAVAMLRPGVQLEIDGENRVPKFGDKPLDEAIKSWADSEEGKFFRSAAANHGGGANGGGGGTGEQNTMTRAAFTGLSAEKKVDLSKKGIRLTD